MSIYHLHVSTGNRKNGSSAKAKAQYIQREDKYERQEDRCLHRESGHMPEWAEKNPTDYWEAADNYERQNGRLYKEVEFSLPRELPEEERLELARDFAERLTREENLPYTLAVHEGRDEQGQDHNPHAHVLISERVNDGIERDEQQWFKRFNREEPEQGGAEKSLNLRSKEWLDQTRAGWAQEANRALEREGLEARIDHRSLQEQGIDRVAQRHLGVHAMAMEERGLQTERGHEFERIEQLNARHELERSQAREHERTLEASQEREQERGRNRDRDQGYSR